MKGKGLTAKAQKVINQYAQEEARNLNAEKVEPEHIFLGLIKKNESIAITVLQKLNVNIDKIKIELENSINRSTSTMVLGELPISERVKKVLTYSTEEAQTLHHHYIGTEHLLLGLFREENGTIYNILETNNVTLAKLRRTTVEILGFGSIPKTEVPGKNKKTPTIDNFGQDFTALAKENKLDPVIGREREISRVIQILSRRTKNNPILIGEPGVGKSAIVEGLANSIIKKETPDLLLDKRVICLNLSSCVAGTKYRGEFEERMKNILIEIKRAQNIVLFIDEIHTIIGAGGAEGAMDAANILKPSLSRGEIQCIGATTMKEYKKYIEKDTALVRRFQSIIINEPTTADTVDILDGLKEKYEEFHNIKYEKNSLQTAALYAKRYLTENFLPDSAIDLIDEAGAKARVSHSNRPDEINQLELEIDKLNKEKNNSVNNQEFEKAAAIRDKILTKKDELNQNLKEWNNKKKEMLININSEHIKKIISEMTDIPLQKLDENESQKLLKLETELHQRIIAQDEAINAVAKAIRRSRTGLKNPNRPAGSFIFLGPTGVGKTELVKVLTQSLFGSEDALIRINMSEFMEKHSASRLIGSPPGYVGYEEGGDLTDKVRRRPYSIILFDELEKAHHDVFNILLQVFEDGYLEDNLGHKVDFTNTFIIMTSNLGGKDIIKDTRLGFNVENETSRYEDVKGIALDELKQHFNPEFLNRIDETIIFHPLTKEHLSSILDLMLAELSALLKEKHITLTLQKSAKNFIINKGYDKKFGARPLRRVLQEELENLISLKMLEGNIKKGDHVTVSCKNKNLHIKPEKKAAL